jgi:hypothetical protein
MVNNAAILPKQCGLSCPVGLLENSILTLASPPP